MTRRRKHRGERRAGLFVWGDHGEITTPEQHTDNPLTRPCDPKRGGGGCGAPIGERCTRPARGGRRPISGYHDCRKTPQEQP